MISINDQTQAGVYINGQEVVLDSGNFLTTIHIASSAIILLPTLHLNFTDRLNQVTKLGLTDGSQIRISIKNTTQIDRTFRVFSWKRTPHMDGFTYKIDGYWDSIPYWMTTSNKGIKGSSAEVLKQIASTCGLTWFSQNDSTSDTMIWLQNNQSYGMFAKSIARRGYINDTSHMALAVDTVGALRYRNMNTLPPASVTIGYNKPDNANNFMTVVDVKTSNKSGGQNALAGYLHTRYSPEVTNTTGLNEVEDKLDFTSDSNVAMLNSEVRTAVGRGGVSFAPIGSGNTHPKYERAKYQNTRYNMLYSITGEFLLPAYTPLECLDKINYISPNQQNNDEYDGEYKIVGKTILIAGKLYYEKITAHRNGLTDIKK